MKSSARWIVAEGADASRHTRSIPIDKACDDVLVAYGQNGEAVRPEQGYPVRLLVPGWEGNVNVKWLTQIRVVDRPAMSRSETAKYVDLMPDGTSWQFSFVMEAKSVITRPAGGQSLPGPGAYEITWAGLVGPRSGHTRGGLGRWRKDLDRRGSERSGIAQSADTICDSRGSGMVARQFCNRAAPMTPGTGNQPVRSWSRSAACTRAAMDSITTTASRRGSCMPTARCAMCKARLASHSGCCRRLPRLALRRYAGDRLRFAITSGDPQPPPTLPPPGFRSGPMGAVCRPEVRRRATVGRSMKLSAPAAMACAVRAMAPIPRSPAVRIRLTARTRS